MLGNGKDVNVYFSSQEELLSKSQQLVIPVTYLGITGKQCIWCIHWFVLNFTDSLIKRVDSNILIKDTSM